MSKQRTKKLQRLQTVLDGHGANVSRWPQGDQQLVEFIKETPEAEQLFLEAGALDHLLDLSGVNDLAEPKKMADLQTRILADFASVHESNKGDIVPFTGRKSPSAGGFVDAGWFMPTALAACFAIGIYLGGIGFGDWTLDPANSIAALSSNGDQLADMADIVMSASLEEDLL